MLLKSIKLENFRQFRNESIDFAMGEDGKNVTLIIGENGTGKTTFAQAFFWCLYSETSFNDKNLLNKVVASEMMPDETRSVKVILELIHGEVLYALIREQEYKKNYSNKVKASNTTFNIAMKDESGKTTYVKPSQLESAVREILPRELANYFFFDGERIDKMGKEISYGKKVTDFAEAVKGLLGLNAIISAIDHLNPRKKDSVIGKYEQEYDVKGNEKIKDLSNEINSLKESIDSLDSRIEELATQSKIAQDRKTEKIVEIKQYEDGEKLQQERERLIKRIDNEKKASNNIYKAITDEFNSNLKSFFTISLIKQSLKVIEKTDLSGKDIPHMHAKTVDYLLDKGECICGTQLNEGSIAYYKVNELRQFLPPQSISTTISAFKKESRSRIGNYKDLPGNIMENLAILSNQSDNITDYSDDLNEINKTFSGEDVTSKVRAINKEIKICNDTINNNQTERDNKIKEMERQQGLLDKKVKERSGISLRDENNKKIEIYKTYAESVYEELLEVYTTSENEIRKRLEDSINNIFKKIYNGGLYLTIDSNYRISVYVTDYEGDVETSTAQSISVIFAFITGIIKLARENRENKEENAQLLSSEPYPLVMDAPLSAFDKRRIKSVCETLPGISDQVVIFIKDLDGELAEKYMVNEIGSRHYLEKLNEFETILK